MGAGESLTELRDPHELLTYSVEVSRALGDELKLFAERRVKSQGSGLAMANEFKLLS